VPISRLAECIDETRSDIAATDLLAPIVGHVGDGNFHIDFVLDTEDEAELAAATRVNERLIARALAMGGTCTGEHGVGQGKIDSVEAERGEAVDVMRALKLALDPANRMNPGKVIRL
jgi:D-lactate dehydrogenase (cytochrome)